MGTQGQLRCLFFPPPFGLWEKYKWWWLPLVELSEMEHVSDS